MRRSNEGSMELDLFPAVILVSLAFDAKLFKAYPKNTQAVRQNDAVNLRKLPSIKISPTIIRVQHSVPDHDATPHCWIPDLILFTKENSTPIEIENRNTKYETRNTKPFPS